jgi:hypothetical protein
LQQKNPNVGAEEDRNSNPVCQMQICKEERRQQIQYLDRFTSDNELDM